MTRWGKMSYFLGVEVLKNEKDVFISQKASMQMRCYECCEKSHCSWLQAYNGR